MREAADANHIDGKNLNVFPLTYNAMKRSRNRKSVLSKVRTELLFKKCQGIVGLNIITMPYLKVRDFIDAENELPLTCLVLMDQRASSL